MNTQVLELVKRLPNKMPLSIWDRKNRRYILLQQPQRKIPKNLYRTPISGLWWEENDLTIVVG